MLISAKSVTKLADKIEKREDVFCSGLFLSARWMVVSQLDHQGLQMIVLPDRDSAEYCASDLYSFIKEDNVFFLPTSGRNLEKSNYKSSLSVQRTSAIGKILEYKLGEQLFIITYPEALSEGVPAGNQIRNSIIRLSVGEEVPYDSIIEILFENGFQRVDFVGEPGQFAVRGALIDIFSYSFNNPFRVSFFGDEIESINIFDCNSQLSKEKVESVEIYPDICGESQEGEDSSIIDMLPSDTLVWMDSSDMYKNHEFFAGLGRFRNVYMELPLSRQDEASVRFSIQPQPVFNKNFELLTEDIRIKIEKG